MATMVFETEALSTAAVTRQVVARILNAISAADWDSLVTLVDNDVLYWRPGTSDRIDGVVAYVQEWRDFSHGRSRLTYRPHTVLVEGDTAMIEATAEGVLDEASGPVTFSIVSIMRVAGGKLAEEREYIVAGQQPPASG